MNAAELMAERARAASRVRDVPASCTCQWTFSTLTMRHYRKRPDYHCPWHTPGRRKASTP